MSWQWPRIRLVPALILLLIFLAIGLAQGSAIRVFLTHRGRGEGMVPVVLQLTGAIGAWIALPIVVFVVANALPGKGQWLRLVALHAGGYVAFTATQVAVIRAERWLLWAVFTVLPNSDGPLLDRVLFEGQNDLLVYGGVATLFTLLRVWQEQHATEVRAAQLEAQLAKAQLEALSARLDPHFLYNALNTVNAVMHEDLARTERLLSDLGQMLRAALAPGESTWTVREERAYAERYVELLEARFDDRIRVDWAFEDGLAGAHVPRFAIQTLVENAAKHNQDRTNGVHVQVSAGAVGDELRITVEDDGRGFGSGHAVALADTNAGATTGAGADAGTSASAGTGTGDRGLARLRRTLALLHGDRGRLTLESAERGGARVTLAFPRVTD